MANFRPERKKNSNSVVCGKQQTPASSYYICQYSEHYNAVDDFSDLSAYVTRPNGAEWCRCSR